MSIDDAGDPERQDALGADTALRLERSAIALFGKHGFSAVTVRSITAHAGVNLAALNYHFGSKRELREACARRVARRLRESFEEVPGAAASRSDVDRLDSAGASELIASSLTALAASIAIDADDRQIGRFLLRELTDEDGTLDVVYGALLGPALERLAVLLDIATDRTLTPEALRIRSLILFGQLQVFVLLSPLATRHLDVDSIDRGLASRIAEQLRAG